VATPTPFFTAKRQRIPCLPIFTRYIPPTITYEGGRSPRRRAERATTIIKKTKKATMTNKKNEGLPIL